MGVGREGGGEGQPPRFWREPLQLNRACHNQGRTGAGSGRRLATSRHVRPRNVEDPAFKDATPGCTSESTLEETRVGPLWGSVFSGWPGMAEFLLGRSFQQPFRAIAL